MGYFAKEKHAAAFHIHFDQLMAGKAWNIYNSP